MVSNLIYLIFTFILCGHVAFSQYVSKGDTLINSQLKSIFLEPRNNISSEVGKSKLDRKTEKVLRKYKKTEIGDIAHDFIAINPHGDSISFSEISSHFKLLVFTSSHCAPCIKSLKELFEVHFKYKDKLTIVSFFTINDKKLWLSYLKKENISWPSLWDGQSWLSNTAIKYGVRKVPSFFLIDNSERIIDLWNSYYEGCISERLSEINFAKD